MQLADMLSLRDFAAAEHAKRPSAVSGHVWVDETAEKFMDWLEPKWQEFNGKFDREGFMPFETFETFVRWEGGWVGEVHQIFAALKRTSRQPIAEIPEEEEATVRPISVRVFLDLRKRLGRNRDVQQTGLAGFQRLMIGKYGSLARAWRKVFDTSDTGKCCYSTFVKGCRANGFTGDARKCWNLITQSEPHKTITMKDWDPQTDILIAGFCKLILGRHGSMRQGWRELIRQTKQQNGRIGEEEWLDVCSHVGFNRRDAKLLFKCLDSDYSRSIDIEEFGFIENWLAQSEKAEEAPKKKERQVLSFRAQDAPRFSPQQGSKATRKPAAAASWTENAENPFAQSAGEEARSAFLKDAAHVADQEPSSFEFVVELTRAEYEDYLRRRRTAEIAAAMTAAKNGDDKKADNPMDNDDAMSVAHSIVSGGAMSAHSLEASRPVGIGDF